MQITERINSLNGKILRGMYPLYDFRRIYIGRFDGTESVQIRAYAVLPKKSESWQSVVEEFYSLLLSCKTEEERLGVEDTSFFIEGKGYKFNDDFNIKTLLNHE